MHTTLIARTDKGPLENNSGKLIGFAVWIALWSTDSGNKCKSGAGPRMHLHCKKSVYWTLVGFFSACNGKE